MRKISMKTRLAEDTAEDTGRISCFNETSYPANLLRTQIAKPVEVVIHKYLLLIYAGYTL